MSSPPSSALPPLPSLFERAGGDAVPVPPLRWRSEPVSSILASGLSHVLSEETASDSQEETQPSNRRKRPRPMAIESLLGDTDDGKSKRPAYKLHREERNALAEEVRALEAELDALRRRAGLPTIEDTAALADTKALTFDFEEKLHRNDRFLGHLHSMATSQLLLSAVNTMSTFIHLPCEMAQRRAILRTMQQLKLRRGIEVMCAWLHHLDETAPYLSEEKFTSATGEYHCHRLEIHQFPNFKTARELYDVYLNFVHELEFSVTETMGQLTLREDTKDFDPTIWNHRIITVAEDVGVPEELNVVGFSQFYDHSDYTNSHMGVVVHDTVNIDDLYPYVPDERTCKDVQAVLMVYEVRRPDTEEVIVVAKQASFVVQLVPQFPVEPRALKQLQDNSMRWPDSIMKFLHAHGTREHADAEELKQED